MENKNFVSKVIPKLILNDGHEITNTKGILQEQTTFYSDLYSNKVLYLDTNLQTDTFKSLNGVKLPDHQSNKLEEKLSYTEITRCLKLMKNNKSPGLDGFTVEFFQFFWINIGKFVLRSLNEAYNRGELSVSLRRGVITCIPRKINLGFY